MQGGGVSEDMFENDSKNYQPQTNTENHQTRFNIKIVITIVAVALIGLSLFFFLRSKNDDGDKKSDDSSISPEVISNPVVYYDKYNNAEMTYDQAVDGLKKLRETGDDILRSKVDKTLEEMEMLKKSKDSFDAAEQAYNNGEYKDAIELYNSVIKEDIHYSSLSKKKNDTINKYYDSLYEQADSLLSKSMYDRAIVLLEEAYEIKASSELQNKIKQAKQDKEKYEKQQAAEKEAEAKKKHNGEVVVFGNYEQDNDFGNGEEPIEWTVLDSNSYGYTLISNMILDCQPFCYENTEDNDYNHSDIKQWLNDYFYKHAFSASEQKVVSEVTLADYETATSFDESFRNCMPTDYAQAMGCHFSSNLQNASWWTKTLDESGSGVVSGTQQRDDLRLILYVCYSEGVRPVIHVGVNFEDSVTEPADNEKNGDNNNVQGMSWDEAKKYERCNVFIESGDLYYPLEMASYEDYLTDARRSRHCPMVYMNNQNYYIQKAQKSDRIICFRTAMVGYKMQKKTGYTIPQELKWDKASQTISFGNPYGVPYAGVKIYEINGEPADNLKNYIQLDKEYYLDYSEPTQIEVMYYDNYEECRVTVDVNTRYYLKGDEIFKSLEETREGYYAIDVSELEAGIYTVKTDRSPYHMLFEVVD